MFPVFGCTLDAGLLAQGMTPLMALLLRGDDDKVLKCARVLLTAGGNVNFLNPVTDMTALCNSCVEGYSKQAELLVQSRANVNHATRDGRTPLRLAAQNKHKDLVRLLIASGADVNLAAAVCADLWLQLG